MKLLVVGAGVGGLAVARGALAAGHDVRVFERAEQPRTTGAAITVWAGGVGILRESSVRLDGAGARIDGIDARTDAGERLYTIDVLASTNRLGHESLTVPRRTLLERMAEGLPPGTVEYGRCFDRFADDGRRVTVGFADGSTATGDVLIGADGHRSAVRRQLWGHDPTTPAGWATWQGLGTFLADVTGPRHGIMINGRSGFCGLMPAGEGLLQWWFSYPCTTDSSGPHLPALRRRFGAWADPAPLVLEKVDEAEIEMFPHYTHRVPPRWGTGRATLVGDAAHTMPPVVAQGANQALEDAWALTAALADTTARDLDGTSRTLRGYERARRRRVAPIARLAATEYTYRYRPPIVDRLTPSPVVSWAYGQWLTQTSDYLRGARRRRSG
ncbi:NAD(P)/FAD-dependent oxidoreductase [Streptomyces sp. NPDC051907]|uniref:FAD-dependent oxidoreductase n=1 Tax=Streptomyces sp. NPDC051907 TaxID=3155284 RepID=UPI0034213EE0